MRLDDWLVSNHYAASNRQAEGVILTGDVLVNDKPVTSIGFNLKTTDTVRLRNQKKWVSRSAEKLDFALKSFHCHVEGKVCIDAGSSTGGFTQVLLEHKASRVFSIDVAYGFLHPVLRNDPRVVVMERTHICDVNESALGIKPDFFVADLSFISIRKVLRCLKKNFYPWEGIILFKPQFEASENELDKGIVKSPEILAESIFEFKKFLNENEMDVAAETTSPIKGRKGNTEFLFYLKWEC
jgi:23S rRNA (cytidine1920-2'-O)/16S rRNA (cytidine1409-2'-O)-methyltransferase